MLKWAIWSLNNHIPMYLIYNHTQLKKLCCKRLIMYEDLFTKLMKYKFTQNIFILIGKYLPKLITSNVMFCSEHFLRQLNKLFDS